MKGMVKLALLVGFLAVVILPAMTILGEEKAGDKEKVAFVGATKCKMCHNKKSSGQYFDDWSKSKHAEAFSLLKGDERTNPVCLKCHTTGFGEPGGFEKFVEGDEASLKMANVQCEMCHGPGEKHIKSKKDNVVKHEWGPEEKTCLRCHVNDGNPKWKDDRYTTKDGKKVGFDFEQAVKIIAHKVKKEGEEK